VIATCIMCDVTSPNGDGCRSGIITLPEEGATTRWFRLLAMLLLVLTPTTALADHTALSQRQAGVSDRYQQLEELLLRLADMEVAENPERAALLRRAARQSRDKFVLEKLRTATESIQTEEYQKAVESQESAGEELGALLTLLMSEDRSKRIRDEKERYRKLIKDLKRNLNNQRSARARTENDADIEEVKKEQKSVTERSKELKDRLSKENEKESSNDQRENESKDAQPEDGQKNSEQEQGEQKQGEQKQAERTEGKQTPSESQQPSQGNQSESQQQNPEQQQAEPQSPEQQVEQQLQKAIEKMQQAEKELEDANRDQATEQQREAEENLRTAIDRLEQILRQLREEEMQRELAKLESRLRKMAAMQTKILDDTVSLAATPRQQRNRQTDLKAGDLAFEEKKITLEADRAMLLLREEGSSVAFPEVVDQIRSDTVLVSDRLSQTKIDAVSQGIQQDILAALEEMIAALQKAQRDLEEKKRQQQQGQPQQPGQQEQPLVQALAELKLIRTMETRIKSTTERYSGLLESGESAGDDVLPLLQNLSERQNRLYRITRDLVLKRNK
jgi:hypothetical protein